MNRCERFCTSLPPQGPLRGMQRASHPQRPAAHDDRGHLLLGGHELVAGIEVVSAIDRHDMIDTEVTHAREALAERGHRLIEEAEEADQPDARAFVH
jgi:hypothetical protein